MLLQNCILNFLENIIINVNFYIFILLFSFAIISIITAYIHFSNAAGQQQNQTGQTTQQPVNQQPVQRTNLTGGNTGPSIPEAATPCNSPDYRNR